MKESKTSVGRSIRAGVITDLTGALSFAGISNANVARMVINDINAMGGLLGRRIDLYLEQYEGQECDAWVNTRQVWGIGTVNFAVGKIHIDAYMQ